MNTIAPTAAASGAWAAAWAAAADIDLVAIAREAMAAVSGIGPISQYDFYRLGYPPEYDLADEKEEEKSEDDA